MTEERRQQLFIQTRFNVHNELTRVVCPTEEAYRAWCAHRAELFLAVTLPSVLGQSRQDFEWLVYFDVQRNEDVDRVLDALSPHENIHPLFFDGRQHHPWHLMARARVGVASRLLDDTQVVITTKLDSDDGLHRDYLRVIANRAQRLTLESIGEGIALNCSFGALLVDGRFYAFPYEHNPYLALVEDAGKPLRTAMTVQHHKVRERVPVRQLLHRQPLWLQVVHEQNAFNGARRGLLELKDTAALNRMFSIKPAP